LHLQERQLSALGDGDTDALPRYDDQTQALVECGLHLGDRDVLSCTVREGHPLYLTRAEVLGQDKSSRNAGSKHPAAI